jgi:hypothetical protein
MKKLILIIIITIILLLFGCEAETASNGQAQLENSETSSGTGDNTQSSESNNSGTSEGSGGYYFRHEGNLFGMNEDINDVISKIGEPNQTFESPSCAFEGTDLSLYYDGFIIDAYPLNGRHYVLSIVFTDDSVSTPEGIRFGASFDNMVATYGNNYENMLDLFSYIQDGVKLSFLFEEDEIIDISYYYELALN